MKLNRYQLRQLLLREVKLLNEQESFTKPLKVAKETFTKDIKKLSNSIGLFNAMGGDDAKRGSRSKFEEAMQNIVSNLSGRISKIEKDIQTLTTFVADNMEDQAADVPSAKVPKRGLAGNIISDD